MRFHILGLPHTVSSKEYNACAYTQKAVKFGKMMTNRGHEVIHYGHEDSDLQCTEHVPVLTNKDLEIAYGNYDWRRNFFKFDTGDHAYRTFYKNAMREVGKRKQKNDFILPFWGSGVRPVCDAHPDLICVEPGIGYAGGHWAKYKIFESYAIYHAYCGLGAVGTCQQSNYDVVIPNYFDKDDFVFNDKKSDYFLFMGRIYVGKGVQIAVEVTQEIGAKLVIAGQGSLLDMGWKEMPAHVTHIGYADAEMRKKLMSNAKAGFVPSQYVEPFGGVQVEMLLSGTPTISTDWGSFTENNVHGLTGYRCRTYEHYLWAAKNIDRIDPRNCREFAEQNFTFDKVGSMYEEFFQSVLDVENGQGWYERRPQRSNLDWLKKPYPNHPERFNYDAMDQEERPFAKRLAKWIKKEIDPPSLLDIGCGPGMYVEELRLVGVKALGMDIDDRVKNKPFLVQKDVFKISNESFHTVICIETAEHINKAREEELVAKVCGVVQDTLIWTAAQPGQGGIGHINCEPPEHWAKLIEKCGLERDLEDENKLKSDMLAGYHMGWFVNNVMVFRNPNRFVEVK